ncbi:hypothetical protein STEG23_027048 [Scotinomys teguina]
MANPLAPQGPRRATVGSAGLDLCATTRLVLTPQMEVKLAESDFQGPLEPGTDQRDPVWVPERLVRKIQYREDHGNWTGEFDNLMDQLRVAIVTVNSTQLDYWSSALCFDVNLCIFFHRLVEEGSMMAG